MAKRPGLTIRRPRPEIEEHELVLRIARIVCPQTAAPVPTRPGHWALDPSHDWCLELRGDRLHLSYEHTGDDADSSLLLDSLEIWLQWNCDRMFDRSSPRSRQRGLAAATWKPSPLPPASVLLQALTTGPATTAELIEWLQQLDRLRIAPASVYPALVALEDAGFVRILTSDPRRYELTRKGRKEVLDHQLALLDLLYSQPEPELRELPDEDLVQLIFETANYFDLIVQQLESRTLELDDDRARSLAAALALLSQLLRDGTHPKLLVSALARLSELSDTENFN